MSLFPWLIGYRTYIIAAVGVVLNGLHVVAPQLSLPINEINDVLGFLGLGTVRAAIKK